MHRRSLPLFAFLTGILLFMLGCGAERPPIADDAEVVAEKPFVAAARIPIRARPYPLAQVRLLDGPFQAALGRNREYLLLLEPDRLLAGFLANAGLTPKGERYGGWEQESLAGHSLGHYLSACSLMYAATGDERLRERAEYIVGELAACQRASGDGYLAAFENGREAFAEITRGDIRPRRFYLNDIWAPWYTMHKVLSGLRDAYRLAGVDEGLEVMRELGDWTIDAVGGLSEEQFQHMLECEHGGMNEALADLYALTDDERYLNLARRFNHQAVIEPLSRGVDELAGLHGNTQIPKLIGAARQYELTGDEALGDAARYFWDEVVHHHTFAIGGHGDGEYFGPPDKLSPLLSSHTAETCNTYNMLKLTGRLFSWDPRAEYADFQERALFNHILASQHPETGMMCYFIPLRKGSVKRFSKPTDSFWCCVGTGMENHARYGEGIYAGNDEAVYVNLFIASRLDDRERGARLRQETAFPEEPRTRIVFENEQPVEFELRVRRPWWVRDGFAIRVNGETHSAAVESDGYARVRRAWKAGDSVEVDLPMSVRLEPLPDDPNQVAVVHGPVVLAGLLGEARPAEESGDEAPGEVDVEVPYFEPSGPDVAGWLKPVAGKPLRFETVGVGRPRDVEFAPLYEVVDHPYSVYWDLRTPRLTELKRREAEEERARLADLERRTIDRIDLGNETDEKAHNLRGENDRRGRFRGEGWHQAERGWFAFDLATTPDGPVDLVCRYWGGAGRYQSFDILVEGAKIASEKLEHEKPGAFIDAAYSVPARLTAGKSRIETRFQSHDNLVAGSVFECRTTRLR